MHQGNRPGPGVRAIGDTTEGVHGETLRREGNEVKSGKGAVGTAGTGGPAARRDGSPHLWGKGRRWM
jgi:hypothetical protein